MSKRENMVKTVTTYQWFGVTVWRKVTYTPYRSLLGQYAMEDLDAKVAWLNDRSEVA